MSRPLTLLAGLCLLVGAGTKAAAQTPEQKARNDEINDRIEKNLAGVNTIRNQIEAAADLAAAQKRAVDMRTPLAGLRTAIDDKYKIVREQFADLNRLRAENEELKRRLAEKEHATPLVECAPVCCPPCCECCPPRKGKRCK